MIYVSRYPVCSSFLHLYFVTLLMVTHWKLLLTMKCLSFELVSVIAFYLRLKNQLQLLLMKMLHLELKKEDLTSNQDSVTAFRICLA